MIDDLVELGLAAAIDVGAELVKVIETVAVRVCFGRIGAEALLIHRQARVVIRETVVVGIDDSGGRVGRPLYHQVVAERGQRMRHPNRSTFRLRPVSGWRLRTFQLRPAIARLHRCRHRM